MGRGIKDIRGRLTDRGVKAFIAAAQAGTAATKKLADGAGLAITLTPAGSPVWRLRYSFAGKEKLLSLGAYPEVTLEAARTQRDVLRGQLRAGNDPSQTRAIARLAATTAGDSTFATIANAWLEKSRGDWSAVHYEKSKRAFERDVFPALGKLPIAQITAPMLASVALSVSKRGARDTAGRILQHVGGVMRYAEALGLVERDPSQAAREILPRKGKTGRRAALLEADALRDILRRADLANISPSVRIAHRLAAFTAARIGNVVEAEWSEFALDGDLPQWVVPRAKMKAKDRFDDHKIVLGPTIAAELRAWRATSGGEGYVFPSPAGGDFISRESIEKVLRVTLGLAGRHTVHGWRAAFSSLARDNEFSRDVVELTLDHVHDTEVVRAYDRGERLEERKRLMYWWDGQLSMTAAQ